MFAQFKFYIYVEIKNAKVNHGVESIVVHVMKISHKIGDNGWLYSYTYLQKQINTKHERNLQNPPIVLNLVKILNSTYFMAYTRKHTSIIHMHPLCTTQFINFHLFIHSLSARIAISRQWWLHFDRRNPWPPFSLNYFIPNWNALLLWCLNLIVYGWFLHQLTEMQQCINKWINK